MPRPTKTNIAQVRLLLPQEWLDELTTIAESRFVSRLSLIRSYLRREIDEELSQLEEHFAQRERQKATRSKLDSWLEEKEGY